MINKKQYVEYLISTPNNWTCTNLANHSDGFSHDTVSDYLRNERLTARHLWALVRGRIQDSPEAFLIADDSVQDKRYARFIELVKRQYSGTEHGVVNGIGIVNLVHSNGKEGEYYPIDYRIYAPDQDGKTKNEHFREMFLNAITDKQIQARKIVFDSWYAGVDNLKLIHRSGWTFFTTLKDNRLVSLSKEGGYIHLDKIEWNPQSLTSGVIVKLKEVPFHVRLFKLVAPNGDIDWVVTNCLDETVTAQVAQDACDVRWQIEELHRGLKQLTGTEKCQCRNARSQRNHLACCYHAWLSLKVKAVQLGKTLYQVRAELFNEYLCAELRHPHIPACDAV
jgi:DDE superfamily endonuclease